MIMCLTNYWNGIEQKGCYTHKFFFLSSACLMMRWTFLRVESQRVRHQTLTKLHDNTEQGSESHMTLQLPVPHLCVIWKYQRHLEVSTSFGSIHSQSQCQMPQTKNPLYAINYSTKGHYCIEFLSELAKKGKCQLSTQICTNMYKFDPSRSTVKQYKQSMLCIGYFLTN